MTKSTSVWIMTRPCISHAITHNSKNMQNIVVLVHGMYSKWKYTPFKLYAINCFVKTCLLVSI